MDTCRTRGRGFALSPPDALNNGGMVLASIAAVMSERVSPLIPSLKKRSWFWGSVDLWSEGGAVDNGRIVIHGKLPVSPPGELSTHPWTVRLP